MQAIAEFDSFPIVGNFTPNEFETNLFFSTDPYDLEMVPVVPQIASAASIDSYSYAPSSPEPHSTTPVFASAPLVMKSEPIDAMPVKEVLHEAPATVPSLGAQLRAGTRQSRAALAALAAAENNSDSSSDTPEYEGRKRANKMGKNERECTEEERIVRRRKKNREAAQQSRLRKRLRLESLEAQLAEEKARHELTLKAKITAELDNARLRKQLECMMHGGNMVSLAMVH